MAKTKINTSDTPTFDARKLCVYTASAGSGKTYTLTQSYIRLAITMAEEGAWQPWRAAAILAITFTNASAADMKLKIVSKLNELSLGQDEKMADMLQAETGLTKALIQERCAKVLHYLLHDYSNFAVQTIDSFVQRVVRPFSFELGLPRSYEPDIDIERWVADILERLLASYGMPQEETLTLLMDGFLRELAAEEQGKMNMVPVLERVLKMAFEEKSEENMAKLSACDEAAFLKALDGIEARRKQCEDKALAIYKKMAKHVKENHLESGCFHEGKNGFWSFFKEPMLDTGRAVMLQFESYKDKPKWRNTVEKGFLKKEYASPHLVSALQAGYDELLGLKMSVILYEADLEKHFYALALTKRAGELKNKIQLSDNRVPISEFNRKIHELLQQTDVPYLYERAGAKYHHILVDEFQDTSTRQWENLQPLIKENIANGRWNMVVGDPKQSIYRFRSANPDQMLALRESGKTGNLASADSPAVQNETLCSNWRSSAGIIAFNNRFYQFLLEFFQPEKTEHQLLWEAIKQRLQRIYGQPKEYKQYVKTDTTAYPEVKEDKASKQDEVPPVRICFYDREEAKAKAEAEAAESETGEEVTAETYDEWTCRMVEAILRQYQGQLSEVAILCRSNLHVNKLASYLLGQGFKIYTENSLLLRNSLTVRLVVAALRYMAKPTSRVAPQKLRWFWMQKAILEAGHADLVSEEAVEAEMPSRLKYLRGLSRSGRTLYDKVQHILRTWNLREQADQYLLSFLDEIQESGAGSEDELVKMWDEKLSENSRLKTDAALSNTICLNTIHKSKGLEYPTVIYAFASETPKDDGYVWSTPQPVDGFPVGYLSIKDAKTQTVDSEAAQAAEKEEIQKVEDLVNLMYVGTTRPKRQLYILSKGPKRSRAFAENRFWDRFVDFCPKYRALETEFTEAVSGQASAGEDGAIGAASAAIAEPTVNEPDTPALALGHKAARVSDWMTRFEPTFSWHTASKRPEQIWGEFIHAVLSDLGNAQHTDRAALSAAVEKRWPTFQARWSSARAALSVRTANRKDKSSAPTAPFDGGYEIASAVAQIENVLSHPQLQPWWQSGLRVYSERDLCCDGQTYRPDRVAESEREVCVIDYKTGEERAEHITQVNRYRDYLHRKTHKPVCAYIVYIAPDSVCVKEV